MTDELEVIATLNLEQPRDVSGLEGNDLMRAIAEDIRSGAGALKVGVDGVTYVVSMTHNLVTNHSQMIPSIYATIEEIARIARQRGIIPTEITLKYNSKYSNHPRRDLDFLLK